MPRLVYFGLLILVVGCGPSQPAPPPSPSAQVKPVGSVAAIRPPGAPRVPVTVDGEDDTVTYSFRLDGGRYEVAWSVKALPTDGGCSGALTLMSADDPTFERSIAAGIDAKTTAAGATDVDGVQAGSYSVFGISNCPAWTVTFTPA